MKILITGINGLLGKDILQAFVKDEKYELFGVGRKNFRHVGVKYTQLDLTNYNDLKEYADSVKPDAVIHCAAYTKLDACEENKKYAYKMNVDVTEKLSSICNHMIYMSSDAVFSGNKGLYSEDDNPDPVNYYGLTKYQGELAASQRRTNLIIRSSIFGYSHDTDNVSIAEWGLKNLYKNQGISGFEDVYFNPLYSRVLGQKIKNMCDNRVEGLYHLGSIDRISKYEFFVMLADKLGVDRSLVTASSVKTKSFIAKRTLDTSLSTAKYISEFGCGLSVDKQIEDYVADAKQYYGLV